MSIDLIPIVPCSATPAESCAPTACTLPEVYRSLQAICARLYELEAKVEALSQSIPTYDAMAELIRKGVNMENRMKRMEQSAIICITWNQSNCAIQGTTSTGTVKVFDPDPCSISLQRRVALLESVTNAIGAMADLTTRVTELETKVATSLKSVSMGQDCTLAVETVGGAVTLLDVHGCAPATVVLMQQLDTVAGLEHVVTFDVPNDSVVEIYGIFMNPADAAIYNFDVLNEAGDSINAYHGPGYGNVFSGATPNKHMSRTGQINLTEGIYRLKITENAAADMTGLQVSLQLKSII